MAKNFKLITDGLVKNNPTFVLLLGMCPTLATTTSAINGLSMGLATLFVLVLSNMVISLIAPVVPDKVHIPVYGPGDPVRPGPFQHGHLPDRPRGS